MFKMFEVKKAQRLAEAAWEIVSPGPYINSPVIRYRIDYDSNGYIYVYIIHGYQIKITLGDELNGDRVTVLEAKREGNASGALWYNIDSYHHGKWDKIVLDTCKNLQITRRESIANKFVALDKFEPAQKLHVVLGGKENE